MTSSTPLDDALHHLSQALDKLQDTVEQRLEIDGSPAARAIEIQSLAEDRARLAQELDASLMTAAHLRSANRDVARRLEQAITTIRNVLDGRT